MHIERVHLASSGEQAQFKKKLESIRDTQRYIQDHFIGHYRVYCFIDDVGRFKHIEMQFSKRHFMHLCGVNYVAGGAKRFWSDIRNKKVKYDNLYFKNDGTTIQKLNVVGSLPLIDKIGAKVTKAGSFLQLDYLHMIRTGQHIVGLALNTDHVTNNLIPISLLDIRSNKFDFPDCFDIIAILNRDMKSNDYKLVAQNKKVTRRNSIEIRKLLESNS